MDLSIIVPIYNVEKYVRTCIESIFRQGLDENRFEVIIVNDGTQDKSMEVITDIISQHSNIIVIEQENQGLSVARNNGIAKASGEYLFMPDSDDLLFYGSLKQLLEIALTTKSDMVIADFEQMSSSEIEAYLNSPTPSQQDFQCIQATGEELLDESLCRSYWRSLYRKEFLTSNGISFIPGITAQDIPFTNECLLKAHNCLRCSWPLVIYRWGHPSTTFATYTTKRAKNLCVAIARIWELSKCEYISPATKQKQIDIVFTYFYALISAVTFGHIKEDSKRIEIIDYMRDLCPDLCFWNGYKQKIWTFMYKYAPHTFIRLYYFTGQVKKIPKRLSAHFNK
jgi:glycosyltransferase involved in cell wall biosynthesis